MLIELIGIFIYLTGVAVTGVLSFIGLAFGPGYTSWLDVIGAIVICVFWPIFAFLSLLKITLL